MSSNQIAYRDVGVQAASSFITSILPMPSVGTMTTGPSASYASSSRTQAWLAAAGVVAFGLGAAAVRACAEPGQPAESTTYAAAARDAACDDAPSASLSAVGTPSACPATPPARRRKASSQSPALSPPASPVPRSLSLSASSDPNIALSAEMTNTQSIEIKASAMTVWDYLADVCHLETVHVPVYRVEVLEHNTSVNESDQTRLSVTRWKQHADWGGPRQVKKVEEILTSAVFNAEKGVGHVDSIRVRRCDDGSSARNEFMHFSHRFLVEQLDGRRDCCCRLSEVEVLESNERAIDSIRSNTGEKTHGSFRQYQAVDGGRGSASRAVRAGQAGGRAQYFGRTPPLCSRPHSRHPPSRHSLKPRSIRILRSRK
eukprot:COSAG06_NODE_1651_length_8804_cov_4.320620_1_plen_372_part_00